MGGTGRTNNSLKAVVKLIEKICVGRLCDIGDGSEVLHGVLELIKPFEQGGNLFACLVFKIFSSITLARDECAKGTAIEPLSLPPTILVRLLTLPIQTAEKDFGNFAIIVITVPIGGRLEVFGPHLDTLDEGLGGVAEAYGFKLLSGIINLSFVSRKITPLPKFVQQMAKIGLQGINLRLGLTINPTHFSHRSQHLLQIFLKSFGQFSHTIFIIKVSDIFQRTHDVL
ncbi:phosphoglycolate phosphatase [Babesia caballi]|uniref:Phosphoglycolate phosphatase n=1 Tax=Babesia caballi TaxID=5871 RepID=A0AAV4LRJ4_BABCB|nr:phosphoglycolate phosphatase [Babesia caballi]